MKTVIDYFSTFEDTQQFVVLFNFDHLYWNILQL